MANAVTIAVRLEDGTGPDKDKIKGGLTEWGKSLPPVKVTATNPIDDAWRAQVNAEIKAAAKEALEIPATGDFTEFRAQAARNLADFKAMVREPVPLGPADAEQWRASLLAAVRQTRAEIGAIVVPVEAQAVQGTVPDLTSPEQPAVVASFRPSAPAGPVFGAGGDPYLAAKEKLAAEPPLEIPVRAKNPIDEAFVAQVRSSVRSVAVDALKIPAVPELEGFQAQLEQVLTELSETSRVDVPVDVGDAMIFREQVAELVAQVEASTKAVIDIEVSETGLSDLQTKTVAASQAELELVQAQQDLNKAMAEGDEEQVAKARQNVVSASKQAAEATVELEEAQAAAAGEAEAVAEAEDVAAASSRGLMSAMGPLWMIMNVAQIAMFAFGSSSSDAAKQTQDASAQIMSLGVSAGQTTQSLLGGNQSLQQMAHNLSGAGTSATQFAEAFAGSVGQARTYTDGLDQQMAALGATIGHTGGQLSALDGRPIADIAQIVKDSDVSQLPQGLRDQVEQYKALEQVVPQAKMALQALIAEQNQERDTLAALGFTMNSAQQANNDYGLSVQSAAKAFMDATAGSRYLEDSTDKATITAGQGIQAWQQLQAQVASAGAAYDQAAAAVGQAQHSVAQAEQGVQAARRSEEQATRAVGQAQESYRESLYQEVQAQDAVKAARAAAEQQLVSLRLQAEDASTSALSAQDALFQATQNASKLGVTPGNARRIAAEPETAANQKQVEAAIALIQAEDQLADAQNSSKNAQDSLNTARKQGVDNNPQVLAAEHALEQAQQGVKQAAQGIADAEEAQQQAAQQVANAEYGVQQASEAVTQARRQELAAEQALTAARDAASRSTDANTLAGAQNRQEIEKLFDAEVALHGPTSKATSETEIFGEKMGFSRSQIDKVIKSLEGLDGTKVNFDLTGTPSIDPAKLRQTGDALGLSFATNLGGGLVRIGTPGSHASGGAAGGLAWVGEQGKELVDLPPGSTVIPHANAMSMLARGEAPMPGFAAGGAVGAGTLDNPMAALAVNFPLAGQWAGLDAVAQVEHAFGGPAVKLPPPPAVDIGSLGLFGASHPTGNRARNKEIMQQVFSTFGWGSGAQWAAQDYLEMREAGYDNYAQNPTSTAFGMGQFLDSTWASVGLQKTADPTLQSWGMAKYEQGRYGSPLAAAAHERAVNWYGQGGGASGVVGVGDQGSELVRLPGGGGGAGPVEVRLILEVDRAGDSQVGTLIRNLSRTGVLRFRTVDGTQVVVS